MVTGTITMERDGQKGWCYCIKKEGNPENWSININLCVQTQLITAAINDLINKFNNVTIRENVWVMWFLKGKKKQLNQIYRCSLSISASEHTSENKKCFIIWFFPFWFKKTKQVVFVFFPSSGFVLKINKTSTLKFTGPQKSSSRCLQ